MSPHRVARYYFHECDRYLRYTATPWKIKGEEGVPKIESQDSPLTDAILKTGYTWEDEILASYLTAGAVVADPPADKPDQPVTERTHTPDQTLEALWQAKPGQYIYQPTLVATDSFYERYGLDRDLIEFTECRPDLLMIREVSPVSTAGPSKGESRKAGATGGQLEIVVIDAKATDEQRLAHRIQATLYSLILEHILIDHGLGHLKVSREGGVWLHKQPQPELFGLSGTR
ncbi:MAG: hypothetical protein ACRDIU_04155, partial [Actinomycetota bacterium]